MDFVEEAEQYAEMDREAPPPTVLTPPAQREAERVQERRDSLDPELFGDGEPPAESAGPAAPNRFSPLRVRALLRAFNRGLSIVEPTRGDIADYQLAIGPAAGFGFEYYPGAHFTNSELAHVGLQFNFHHSFAVESGGPNGTTYPTNELSWLLGARYRAVLSPDVVLGAELGAGQQSYHVERGDLSATGPAGVPFVDFSFVRIGGSARVRVGEFTLGGRIAYLPSFDLGGIGTELGGGMGHGVEVGVAFLYPIDLGFSFIAELDARVFVLDFDSPATSRSAAGGAVDHYVGLNVGVEFDLAADAL